MLHLSGRGVRRPDCSASYSISPNSEGSPAGGPFVRWSDLVATFFHPVRTASPMTASPSFTYQHATAAHFGPNACAVWNALMDRQRHVVTFDASRAFVRQFKRLQDVIHAEKLPDLHAVEQRLHAATGWRLIPTAAKAHSEFDFRALSRRLFGVSMWLRDHRSFDDPGGPDFFHDVVGCVPALMDADFSDLLALIGQIGESLSPNFPAYQQLQNFTRRLVDHSLLLESGASSASRFKPFGAAYITDFQSTQSLSHQPNSVQPFHITSMMAPLIPHQRPPGYLIPSWKSVGDELLAWFTAHKSSSPPDPECFQTVQCT